MQQKLAVVSVLILALLAGASIVMIETHAMTQTSSGSTQPINTVPSTVSTTSSAPQVSSTSSTSTSSTGTNGSLLVNTSSLTTGYGCDDCGGYTHTTVSTITITSGTSTFTTLTTITHTHSDN